MNTTELLIQNGQLVADTLRHLADNEIDSDYFAITSASENGTEIEHELVITDYALQAASTVEALVEALESAQRTIAEQDQRLINYASIATKNAEKLSSVSEEEMRQEFEQWAELEGAHPWGYLKKQRNAGGGYSVQIYSYMWTAWKASRSELGIKCEVKGG